MFQEAESDLNGVKCWIIHTFQKEAGKIWCELQPEGAVKVFCEGLVTIHSSRQVISCFPHVENITWDIGEEILKGVGLDDIGEEG